MLRLMTVGVLLAVAGRLACADARCDCDQCDSRDRRIAACTEIIQQNLADKREQARTLRNRGNAYHDNGQFDEAIRDFDKAIEFEPLFAATYLNRAYSYVAKGESKRARHDIDAAMAIETRFWAVFALGLWKDKALLDQRIERLNPYIAQIGDAEGLKVLAHRDRRDFYALKGLYDLSIQEFGNAIQLAPDQFDLFSRPWFVIHSDR